MRKFFLGLLIFLSLATAVETEDILRRETGARALGMGGAFSGTASDASALHYNPAGLAKPGAQFTYSEDDLSRRFYSSGVESALKFGNIGFGRRRFTDEDGYFVDAQSLGFGVRGKNGIDYGLAYRRVIQETPEQTGSAWTADAGLLLHFLPSLRAGLNLQNISRQGMDSDPSFRLGAAYEWQKLLLAADTELYTDGAAQKNHYGLEWQAADGFALRLGSNEGNLTYGLSAGLGDLIWEYAVEKTDEGSVYRFAVKLGSEFFPKIRQYSLLRRQEVLLLTLDSALIAGQSETSVLGGQNTGLDVLLQKIRVAAEDKNIAALLIRLNDLPGSISSAALWQELRAELKHFKARGKPIVVYIENDISAGAYYLATIADRIVIPSMGAVTPLGQSLTVTRMRGLLEKLGLTPVILRTGDYKDALNPFSAGFTPKQRAHIEELVSDIHNELLAEIGLSRKISSANLAELLDGSLVSGQTALAYGLVDALGYYPEAENQLRELLDIPTVNGREPPELEYIQPEQLYIYEEDNTLLPDFNTLAVVDIDGELIDGASQGDFLFGGKKSGADTLCRELRQIGRQEHIRAVVVRINSPGGSPFAADRIYQELLKLKDRKKYVVVSIGNMAASGGYYIAAAADEIYANPLALVGSIGVIGQTFKAAKLFAEWGIKQENIKTAEYADMNNLSRELTAAETAMLLRYQGEVYDQFKLAVALGRNLHISEVDTLAQGKIYTARRAADLRLVDKLGTFFDALEAAKAGARIKGRTRIIRGVKTENGWTQLRYNIAVALGLDKLSLKNYIRETPAELNSHIY
ncbi:MAG: signal peptide peptidase SppA [Candidatus Margulisbacteria bacterium]|jgi:protease-4|nr:signal peptide peptidase SppA [Candidatus Margulisiibacteriota bacterium]